MYPALQILLLALGPVLAFGSGSAAAEEDKIHACPDEKGNIVFQTEPCRKRPDKKDAPSVPAPQRPSVAPPTKPSAPAARERKPRAPSEVRRATSRWMVVPRTQSPPRAPRRITGKQTFPTSLAGAAPPPSPSFVSPEHTWRTFLAAIESDDRTAAVACFTPAALDRLGADAETFPVRAMREMMGTFTRIENGGDLGFLWSIYGVRESQRPKWIFFEQTAAGEWKIAGI